MENRKWVAVGGWWLKEAWQWHPAQLTSLNLLFLLVWQLLLGRFARFARFFVIYFILLYFIFCLLLTFVCA